MSLLSGMDHDVERQLFLAFKGLKSVKLLKFSKFKIKTKNTNLHANRTDERPFRVVALLVARQVVLAFERGVANIANKPTLQVVPNQMLLEQFPLRVGHLALGTQEQRAAVQCGSYLDLTRFRSWLALLWGLFLLFLFLLVAGGTVGRGAVYRTGTGGGS